MMGAMRQQQAIVEEGNRKAIGLWLREAAAPGDTVFLETLGYIGYYSNLRAYDFPGLASEEVVAARRKLGTDEFDALIRELRPTWLVLRPEEAGRIAYVAPGMLLEDASGQYRLVRRFDQSARIAALGDLRGRYLLNWDRAFLVYRRSR